LIVTTPSLLAFETVKKQVTLLCELKAPIIGVVENMKQTQSSGVELETKKIGLRFLGEISFDPNVEAAIGDETKLLATSVGKAVKRVVEKDILVKG
jgi:Mrp family chromosome partitioning ATPase